jgi:mono/diheme cytochrome c family protein
MKVSYRGIVLLVVFLAVGLGASRLFSRENPVPQQQKPAASQGDVERGKYLVDDVAMCSECHTPRDSNGNTDNSRYLQGAPIWITPVHPNTDWANRAPALAGFLGFTDAQGEDILEKGIGPNGLEIQPPMHIYHMNQADAKAIIAYLRSLPSSYPQ